MLMADVRQAHRLALTGLALLCCMGCGSRYARNRIADLADVMDLEVSVGPGLDLHVRAGCIGTGFGGAKQRGLVCHGRQFGYATRVSAAVLVASVTTVEDESYSLGTLGQSPSQYDEHAGHRHDVRSLLLLAHWQDDSQVRVKAYQFPQSSLWPPHWWQALDLEVGGSLAIAGLHLGIAPGELLDFLLGVFTLDLVGDDLPTAVLGPAPTDERARSPAS